MRTRHGFTLIEVPAVRPFDKLRPGKRGRPAFTLIELPAVRKRGRPAFTLIELLFVIGIIAVLVTVLVPVVGDVLSKARMAECMTNMRHVSGAIANKLPENAGNRMFGLIHSDGITAEVNGALGDDNLLANLTKNAMQNVWQMIDSYEVSPRAFKCAADGGWEERPAAALKHGWTQLTEFSYGIQYPYGTYGINAALKDRAVIMADRNPGGPVNGSTTKHSNHKNGVVVLFYDGNAKFYEADDSLAGYGGDEIYANTVPTAGEAPTYAGDTSITPVPSRLP